MSLYIENDSDYLNYVKAIKSYCGQDTPFTQYQEAIEKFRKVGRPPF